MKDYILEFAREFDFPAGAGEALAAAYDRLVAEPENKAAFFGLLNRYEQDMNCDYQQLITEMSALSQQAGIHEYEGGMILPICMAKTLKRYYAEANLPEEMWFTAMSDLKWKLVECKNAYDIWGSFVARWFSRFYSLTRFGFGKLQFEAMPMGIAYEKDGLSLTEESWVINVHIPRTGTRLDQEGMRAAYARAAAFFRERDPRFAEGPMVFKCWSWLLYPKHAEVLKPGSNLHAFFSDYDIVDNGVYENYNEVWRLFDVNYTGDVEQLPQNSSLRRTYADWIRKGEKTGWGLGVYVYDNGK